MATFDKFFKNEYQYQEDEISQQYGIFTSVLPMIQSLEEQMKENVKKQTFDNKYFTGDYIVDLTNKLKDIQDNIKLLLGQEQQLQQNIPIHGLLCRNHQEDFYKSLQIISNAYGIIEEYKEQQQMSYQMFQSSKDEILNKLTECLKSLQYNMNVLEKEAIQLNVQ